MSDSGKGIGEKLMEAGLTSLQAGADEIKTGVSTAVGQITGQVVKNDQELQQIASHDKESSGKRINEIQQELAKQKMKRFQEVSTWHASAASQTPEEHQSKQSLPRSSAPLSNTQNRNLQPEPVRQAVGNKELGRNFKG